MKVLVPVDASDCSTRALEFAAEFVRRYDGRLDVVHFTDYAGEETEALLDRARETLADAGVEAEADVVGDLELSTVRYENRIGRDIVARVEQGGYDHVVMGHHGAGAVERAVLGSVTETVVRSDAVPVTVVP